MIDEKVEINSKVKKRFLADVKKLKDESQRFRREYAIKITEYMNDLEKMMFDNVNLVSKVFQTFYLSGNNMTKDMLVKLQSFNNDFNLINMEDSYYKYVNTELPQFDPKWITDDFTHKDHMLFEQITESLEKQAYLKKR